MINPRVFIDLLIEVGIEYFIGVPDSLMSSISKCLHFDFENKNHIISTNEGSALAAGMGYNLATDKYPLIYMQNSGLGNIVNPYTSLMHSEVYDIPFFLLIGWRGEPGIPDEPQHSFQGRITLELLNLLEIEYVIIDKNTVLADLKQILESAIQNKKQLAIVVKKETFENDNRSFSNSNSGLTRSKALEAILEKFDSSSLIVSTTGKLSRELYELRKNTNKKNDDFYVVGGMGHASSISFGLLSQIKDKTIVCLDGDGSILMHMGHLSQLSANEYSNFIHVVFNNSAHESVGGQPNNYKFLDTKLLFNSFGYKTQVFLYGLDEIRNLDIKNLEGPIYIEITVENSSSPNLMRPNKSPIENKKEFIKKLYE